MLIRVNGEPREVTATTLSAVLDELGYAGTRVATALDGAFVAAARREACRLEPHSALEILAPMQGG